MGSVAANGNNQISGFNYDASGNTVNDGSIPCTYNAESEMASAAGVTYTYDAQGRRVTKSSGKNYVYSVGGQILAETDGSGNLLNEYVFFAGKRAAMLPAGGSAQYYVEDMLGTSRIVTTNTGAVCYDADFDPFGGEHPYTNTCSQNYKFEGKERDTESGNDDFGARYYTSRFGRWLSADWSSVPVPVPYANLTNPQTLNLYAMVSDDPESFADLNGHATTQMYQLANPAASSAWDPMGAGSMFDESGLTQEESNALNAVAATEAAQKQAQGQNADQNQQSDKDKQQTPAPTTAGGGKGGGQQPKGERRITRKPELKDKPGKLPKGVRENPRKPGEYQVKDPHTGTWVDKAKGWSPETVTKVAVGVGVVGTALVIIKIAAEACALGACYP